MKWKKQGTHILDIEEEIRSRKSKNRQCNDQKELELEILVFYATFNNISTISWQPLLVVEETGIPGENHRPWASNW